MFLRVPIPLEIPIKLYTEPKPNPQEITIPSVFMLGCTWIFSGTTIQTDLFCNTAVILNSIVSNSYYGMLRGYIKYGAILLNADWLRQRASFLNHEVTFGNQDGMMT